MSYCSLYSTCSVLIHNLLTIRRASKVLFGNWYDKILFYFIKIIPESDYRGVCVRLCGSRHGSESLYSDKIDFFLIVCR